MFRPRVSGPQGWDAETQELVRRLSAGTNREAQRRVQIYGAGDVTSELLRILGLYPMFRLSHAKKARRCLYCNHRIAPLELHFVHCGSYIRQSGTCMDTASHLP